MCLLLDCLQQVRLRIYLVFTQICALGFHMFDMNCGRAGVASDVNFTVAKHARHVSRRKDGLQSQRPGPCAYSAIYRAT